MHEKLKFEQIKKDSCASLRYDYSSLYPKDEMPLHFHPEIEICYVVKGSGYRMIGDFLEPFEEGEVVLVPTNQPHCWMYNPESCEPDGKRRCIVVQFNPDLLQTGLSFFTEWEYAAHRLSAIQQGILLTGETAGKIKSCLEEMNLLNASERMLMLIRILQQIGTTTDLIPIGLQETVFNGITKNMQRMQLIFKYVIEHYKEKITLSDAANVISMSTTAFCSFFKRETGKTFTNFINEYRIEAVGTLLRNFPDKDINEIAWQCGFTDIPYFNRYFKKMKQMYNPESCEPDGKRRCIVVQFNPDLLQTGLSFFTEWEYAAHRLSAIQQGILLTGETAGKIKSCLEEMNLLNASERMLMLIRILQQIGTTTDLIPIGLQETVFNGITKNMQRMQLIFKYVIEHYKEKITLSDAANVISMSTTAFCSFFKRETGKTFTNFINEYRIEAVGTLLRNFPDKDINEIAWQCGFTDIPYFNRYFKKMKQMTPKQWRYEIQ